MDLPIKKAVFDESQPDLGLRFISLVANPAIQVEWVKFSEEQEIKLAIQSEEQMKFLTPVLIPNQLIPRKGKDGEMFNLTFDADTIERIAYNWQKKNLSSSVDIEHSRKLIDGVTFVETFILNRDTVNSVKGFDMLPEGTWFVVGKADSPEAWKPIKDGLVTGVSIDGLFGSEPVEMSISEDDLKAVIAQIL
jgi:hypothetical protein